MLAKEERDELTEYFDGRYVKKEDCDDRSGGIESKVHNDDKRLAVIEYQQKLNNAMTAAIASGIIALVIKIFAGG